MKNWRTTLVGALVAGVGVAFEAYQASQGQPVDWKQVGFLAGFAALSWLAKDAGVTGPAK